MCVCGGFCGLNPATAAHCFGPPAPDERGCASSALWRTAPAAGPLPTPCPSGDRTTTDRQKHLRTSATPCCRTRPLLRRSHRPAPIGPRRRSGGDSRQALVLVRGTAAPRPVGAATRGAVLVVRRDPLPAVGQGGVVDAVDHHRHRPGAHVLHVLGDRG